MAEDNKRQKPTQSVNITSFEKGMNLDVDPIVQPKGSYRYALNTIMSAKEGHTGFLSNELGNRSCSYIPPGFVPIGKCYMVNDEVAIFMVNPDTGVSEIGIFKDCAYETIVNDENSPEGEKLNFNIEFQIQATYRLRRGCDKTVYWVDGLNPPRVINLSNIEQFKNQDNKFIASKFKLIKTIDKLPVVNKSTTKVLGTSGQLKPGSYSVLVQYLDADLNPTKYVELINNIIIYNDPFDKEYGEICGSIRIEGEGNQSYQYEDTTKAIQVDITEKNFNFSYVRYAFIEYTSSTGQASRVTLSDYLPIDNSQFIYTGKNGTTSGTLEEIQLFGEATDINIADHIEQIDNRLILANTKGTQVYVEKLQKYASKIQTDCKVRSVNMNTIGNRKNGYNNRQNPKHPLHLEYGVGYMPGEVYAFGIIYFYEDGNESPVFHIPGKASGEGLKDKVYSPAQGVYPMSNIDNVSTSIRYINSATCNKFDLWKEDCEGNSLANTQVRFHRFPTREEIGIPLFRQKNSGESLESYSLILQVLGEPKKSIKCETLEDGSKKDINCTNYEATPFTTALSYTENNIIKGLSLSIDPDDVVQDKVYISEPILQKENVEFNKVGISYENKDEIEEKTVNVINEEELRRIWQELEPDTLVPEGKILYDDKAYITELENGFRIVYYKSLYNIENTQKENIYANILGVKFSNIELPSKEEIGKEVIGYRIVRLNREESDKTILDTGVLLPMSQSKDQVCTGILAPTIKHNVESISSRPKKSILSWLGITSQGPTFDTFINKKATAIVSLRHKFQNYTPDGTTSIKEVGRYRIKSEEYNIPDVYAVQVDMLQDVAEGTSDPGGSTKETSDNDGWSLKHPYRFHRVLFGPSGEEPVELGDDIEYRFYNLHAVNYARDIEDKVDLVNVSADEKALLLNIRGNKEFTYYKKDREFPYVYFYNNNRSFYQNYRIRDYQLCSTEVFTQDKCEVFGGDTFLSPLRISSMNYMNTYQAQRTTHRSWWSRWGTIIGGALALILAPFTAGTSIGLLGALGVGLIGASGIVYGISTSVEMEKFREVFEDKWRKGLSEAVKDLFVATMFTDPDQPSKYNDPLLWRDDTIGWFTDSLGDIWLESPINASLRIQGKLDKSFLYPQTKLPEHNGYAQMLALKVDRVVKEQSSIKRWNTKYGYVYSDIDYQYNNKESTFYTRKLLGKNKEGKWKYQGIPYPTVYMVNPDYNYIERVKKYYMLPLEYDFCSKCIESFPHRVHYSEQSFQEEKTDNYRQFLPNNYRDIEGETGHITNVFRLYNNLYVHTEEGLWQLPRAHQERVTGEIVTFIGTGSYFEIPPQKLIDDDTGHSAGTTNKWASIKTPHGYFFVTANTRKIYQFDGKSPKAISDNGISKWFYERLHRTPNNPSNKKVGGLISTYDSKHERILFTFRDQYPEYTDVDMSWTISYSLLNNAWVSLHSYKPNFYIHTPNKFYSWVYQEDNTFWNHSLSNNYQTYYNKFYPHIIEYVSTSNPIVTKLWNHIQLNTEVWKKDLDSSYPVEDRYTTFNRAVFYNTRQCSGELELLVQNNLQDETNYLFGQVSYQPNISIIDRTEKNWFINDFRDYRVDYDKSMWKFHYNNETKTHLPELNKETINYNKSWTELESFRDKYLGVRLIFDKFADRKLITYSSLENGQASFY